jgi:metal-responsive CopG/Arc/MetJ family transcriptional regulator
MSTLRTRSSRVFTVSFPENLGKQVEQIAQEESRSISELFREAFRAYRVHRAHESLAKFRRAAAAHNPNQYTQDDIEGFVDEARAELALERKAQTEKAAV